MSKLRIAFVSLLALGLATGALALGQRQSPREKVSPAPGVEAKKKAAPTRDDDPLPDGVSARFGSLRLRHGDYVNAVAFSPDGKMLASCSGGRNGFDNAVRFWDPLSGKLLPYTCSPV